MMKKLSDPARHGSGMRRTLAVMLLTVILTVAAGSAAVFADNAGQDASSGSTFQLVRTTPADGYQKVQAQNVMVKLYFSTDVDKAQSANTKDRFTFTDNKGKKVRFKVYYDQNQKDMIALLAEKDLEIEKKYKITIDGSLVDNEGRELGKTQTVTFMTKNAGGGLVYILLMVAMMVVMVFITIRDQRKKAVEEEAAEGKPAQAKQRNPYKLAKEKGITVEEANRLINKEKEKEQKKIDKQLQKQKRREEKIEKQLEEELEEYQIFRMHTKRVVKRKASGKKKKS